MNQPHEVADKEVITAQLICFLISGLIGFSGSLFPKEIEPILYKFVDALFVTACILVAMKLARKGWDLPASGFTVLSIAWGVFFLAKDFKGQEIGNDIFASAFYFLLPSMILISFYKPFPLFIKILTLICIIPSLIMLVSLKTENMIPYEDMVKKIGYQIIHFASLIWGCYFYWQHKKSVILNIK